MASWRTRKAVTSISEWTLRSRLLSGSVTPNRAARRSPHSRASGPTTSAERLDRKQPGRVGARRAARAEGPQPLGQSRPGAAGPTATAAGWRRPTPATRPRWRSGSPEDPRLLRHPHEPPRPDPAGGHGQQTDHDGQLSARPSRRHDDRCRSTSRPGSCPAGTSSTNRRAKRTPAWRLSASFLPCTSATRSSIRSSSLDSRSEPPDLVGDQQRLAHHVDGRVGQAAP